MNYHDQLFFYGRHVSLEAQDFEWLYNLAEKELTRMRAKNINKDDKEFYDACVDATARVRRFRYELADMEPGTIVQMEKNPSKFGTRDA